MHIDSNILAGVGLIVGPFIWYWWTIHRTRNWPTTDANVIEVNRQSLFERTGNSLYLNLDKDYAIEYSVGGKLYVQTPDIENNVRIGGIKAYKEPAVPKKFRVRYNPKNPDKYKFEHALSKGTILIVFLVPITIGLAVMLGVGNETRT